MERKFEVFIQNDIAFLIYKSGLKIDMETAKEIVNTRIKVYNGKFYPLLIDAREVNGITREARQYLSSEKGKEGINAAVILARSTFTKYMGNFFLKISYTNPSFPAKLFTDKTKALLWLEQYKHGANT